MRKPKPLSQKEGGIKQDSTKPRMSLIPQHCLDAILLVLEEGAERYGDFNWDKGISYTRLLDAAERHIASIRRGELRSDHLLPSGKMGFHASHAICELLFLLSFQIQGRTECDDLKTFSVKEPV